MNLRSFISLTVHRFWDVCATHIFIPKALDIITYSYNIVILTKIVISSTCIEFHILTFVYRSIGILNSPSHTMFKRLMTLKELNLKRLLNFKALKSMIAIIGDEFFFSRNHIHDETFSLQYSPCIICISNCSYLMPIFNHKSHLPFFFIHAIACWKKMGDYFGGVF